MYAVRTLKRFSCSIAVIHSYEHDNTSYCNLTLNRIREGGKSVSMAVRKRTNQLTTKGFRKKPDEPYPCADLIDLVTEVLQECFIEGLFGIPRAHILRTSRDRHSPVLSMCGFIAEPSQPHEEECEVESHRTHRGYVLVHLATRFDAPQDSIHFLIRKPRIPCCRSITSRASRIPVLHLL